MTDISYQSGTITGDARIFSIGRFVLVVVLLTISPLALTAFGWQYDGTGGGPLEKFHPATPLAVLLFLITLARYRNPIEGLFSIFSSHASTIPFLLGILFMILHSIFVVGLPFTIFVDTFMTPLLVYLLFDAIKGAEATRLAVLIHVLMFANALLGIYEFVFAFHLTPLVVNGELLTDELRSTALLGHPLANAALVGCYILMLALGRAHDVPALARLMCFVVNLISMAAFGGRAATGLVLIALVLIVVVRFFDALRGSPINTAALLTALIVIPLFALMLGGLEEYGFFDAFADRLADDDGSASTRLTMFSLFKHLNWRDILIAPDAVQVGTWARIYGLDYGIENFVVSFILSYGLLATLIFLPTLIQFCGAVTRSVCKGGGWIFVYFFIVALTSTSLSSKSPIFSQLIAMMMVLMRPVTVTHGSEHARRL